ncbi:uncharacterized protein LOC116294313 isoform X2 [Actinia tenebrosa]|uniref:Uncharacterized protein LOC116294313 isoform X2 n=1 Tax=Actinia tenebrosa TaxID=6105 RepID=A0A6P8HRL0_ACTTE|nr:uncharacterized protein LOC116294313 isoform X2 [Actinia tenebrosa]
MDDIYINLNFLTESERDALQDVLARDEVFRKQEKKRLSELKKELDGVKKSGAISDTSDSTAKVCARCHESFGVLFNTGAFCPKCKARVCKNCRTPLKDSWLCTLCGKVRDVKAKSGAWFYEQARTKGEARTLFGTSLIRASLKRGKASTKSKDGIADEPPAPPVIGLNPESHEKLHRPIPVHMSAIRETEANDSSYHTAESADDNETHEVNKNYIKPYAKAVPVKRDSHKDESPAETSSGSSTPTYVHETSKGSDTIHNDSFQNEREKAEDDYYDDDEEEEKPVFDYLNEDEHSPQKEQNNQGQHDGDGDEKSLDDSDEYKSIASQGSGQGYHYNSGSRDHYPLPGMKDEYSPPQRGSTAYSQDSLSVSKEWTLSTESNAESVDSFRTAEVQTPSETTSHSDFNTPTQSLPSDNESDFIDARDTAHVPPENEDHYDGYTLEETYTGGGKVVPPEIVTTAVDDNIPGYKNNENDEPVEDIDQAFAEYGVDVNNRSLSDRFDMGSRESIVSYYSEAGEGHYGNIPITGEVQFGLKYNYRVGKLEVQVHRAKDIAPVDTKKNRSDPYVKAYLLPDKTKGGKRKTKVKKNTLNPEFDEILSFKTSFDEMLTRSLWLCVWNHDRFGHNDFLGEVLLPMASYDESGFSWEDPSPQWYPLRERRPEHSLMEYSGELVIALMYVPQERIKPKKGKKKKEGGELHVQIKEGHNLKAKDANGFSDPFCKIYLLPDKSRKTKRKTQTIKKNVNPKWNISFVYEHLTLEDLMDRSLEVTVWDWDRGTSNDFLGGLRLGMGAKTETWDDAEGEEIAAWQKMLDNHNEWNESTIALRSLPRFHDKPATDSDSEQRPDKEKHDKPATDSDSEQRPDKGKHEENPKESSDTETKATKKEENPKPSEKQEKNKEGIDNMAFTTTKDDNEEEKAMNSIFQSFNNFTMPEVTTIVTAPEPSEPEQKPDEKRKKGGKTASRSDNVLFFEGATLSSPDLELKRRHSTDFVSVPRPLNEELIQQDMEKKGIPFKRKSTKKIPQGTREQMRRESYSPRVERKSRSLQTSSPLEIRRKTLAELAIESGYKNPKAPADSVDGSSETLDSEESHEKIISAPAKSAKGSSEIPITGELYLTQEYCQETRVFTVHIHTANNLAIADTKRKTSDPYVKTYLLPDKRSKKKTRTVRDNLNPEFDEVVKYHIGYDELLTRTLLLTVWNDDLFSRDEFLGEVVIPLGSFVEKGNSLINSTAKWYKLGEKTDYEEKLTIPELIVALKYVTGDKTKKKSKKSQPMKGELMLQILEAKNLPGKDADGMSDPFCKISLLPDKKGKTKHKTPIIKRSLNPSWNYKMEYEDLSIDDLNERVLEITVWDHDIASRDEFLGGVRLGTGGSGNEWDDSTEDEAQIWHTMLNRSNVWIQVVIPLRPTMDSRKNM